MKRKILAAVCAVLLAAAVVPGAAWAAGYVASKNSNVFHKSGCSYVSRIRDYNKIYFDTVEEAINSGRRGCSKCNPTAGAVTGSSSNKTSSTSKSAGYYNGYADGVLKGREDGRESGYREGHSDAKKEATAEMDELAKKYEADLNSEIARMEGDIQELNSTHRMTVFFGGSVLILMSFAISGRLFGKKLKEKEENVKKLEMELKSEAIKQKNLEVLAGSSPGAMLPAGIPDGVELVPTFLPVKGNVRDRRPYGDYTVYMTAQGKRYHCSCGCGNAFTPIHLFQVPDGILPCKNCVPAGVAENPVPNWYKQIRNPGSPIKCDALNAELENYKNENQTLIESVNKYNEELLVFRLLSECSGMEMDTLAECLYISYVKGQGKTEAEARTQLLEKKREWIQKCGK